MSYRDIRARGFHYMWTGRPSMADDPFERLVVERVVGMSDSRLLALLRLLADPHEIACKETAELRRRGYLAEAGLTLTTSGWLKLAELEVS